MLICIHDEIHEFHVLQLRIEMNVFWRYLSSREKGLNGHSNPDLCDAGAVLCQLSSENQLTELVVIMVRILVKAFLSSALVMLKTARIIHIHINPQF